MLQGGQNKIRHSPFAALFCGVISRNAPHPSYVETRGGTDRSPALRNIVVDREDRPETRVIHPSLHLLTPPPSSSHAAEGRGRRTAICQFHGVEENLPSLALRGGQRRKLGNAHSSLSGKRSAPRPKDGHGKLREAGIPASTLKLKPSFSRSRRRIRTRQGSFH